MWLISRLPKDGFASLAGDITNGKKRRDKKTLKHRENPSKKKDSYLYFPKKVALLNKFKIIANANKAKVKRINDNLSIYTIKFINKQIRQRNSPHFNAE